MNTKLKNTIYAVAALAAMASCQYSDTRYNTFVSLPDAKWSIDNPAIFPELRFDSIALPGDSIYIVLRHNNSYPYRNMWLFVDYTDITGNIITDTVQFQLSDKFGKWYGTGFGALYEFSAPLVSQKISPAQISEISITQGMRQNTIDGISDIGIILK